MRRIAVSWNTTPYSPPATPRTTPPSGKSWKSDELTPDVHVVVAFKPDPWMREGVERRPAITRLPNCANCQWLADGSAEYCAVKECVPEPAVVVLIAVPPGVSATSNAL